MIEEPDEITCYLNVRRAHGPSWDHDGKRIAYVSDCSGLDQVWIVTPGEEPWQLTHFPDRVGEVVWSKDNEHLIATVDAGGNEHDQLYLLSVSDGNAIALTHELTVIHRFGGWSPDGRLICYSSNQRHPAFFDIWVMDISSGERWCVCQKDATLQAMCWFPDASAVIISESHTGLDQDLFVVRLDQAQTKPRLLTSHNGEATYASAHLSPTGETLYVTTNYQREFLAPAQMDMRLDVAVEGEHVPLRYLVETNWDCEGGLALSPDGQMLAWVLNKDGCSHLTFFAIEEQKEVIAPYLPAGVLEGLTWSASSDTIAFSHNGTRSNGNIWIATVGTECARKVTSVPMNIDVDHLVEPMLIRYTSFDGLSIPAYYYRPQVRERQTEDHKLPVIIFVHGGPESQFRPLYAAPWMPPLQYYLEKGFAVFAPNVRGSAGYGKTYLHLDDVRLRPDSVKDLKYAVDWLIEEGEADPCRIGIMGRSYGGFMVLAALTEYPDLWAAGADIVGIANFLTFFEHTGIWRKHLRAAEYGDPERDAEFLHELSPLFKAERITAPLLVLHGMNDPRVPVEEARQIVDMLRSLDRQTELILFPDEGHFMLRQSTQLQAYPAIAQWFERYMG